MTIQFIFSFYDNETVCMCVCDRTLCVCVLAYVHIRVCVCSHHTFGYLNTPYKLTYYKRILILVIGHKLHQKMND